MKIQMMSDLHNEMGTRPFFDADADVIVLAGDIDKGTRGLAWALECLPQRPIVYVAGNHEGYGHAYPKVLDDLKRQAAGSRVHVLENDGVIIDGVRFLGCTLWTDFNLLDDTRLGLWAAGERMNDYRRIRVSPRFRRLRPEDTSSWHRRSKAWLRAQLAEPVDLPTVVVTHHAPSGMLLDMRRRGDPLSAAYASKLEDLLEGSGVRLWIHGHIHCRGDYRIGGTRVVCNPGGYPAEIESNFDALFMVDLDDGKATEAAR